MSDPVSLALGIAGLSGLIQICVQLADQIKAGISMEKDAKLLAQRWAFEIQLLATWGQLFGVDYDAPNGKLKLADQKRHTSLSPFKENIIGTLRAIESLLRDHKKLSTHYGVVCQVATPSPAPHAARQNTWLLKSRWALSDKKKFEGLLIDFGLFVQQLYSAVDRKDISLSSLEQTSGTIKQLVEEQKEAMADQEQSLANITKSIADLDISIANDSQSRHGEASLLQARLVELDTFLHQQMDTLSTDTEKIKENISRLIQLEDEIRDLSALSEDYKRDKILEWLEAIFTDDEYDRAFRARCPGTCEWILRRQEFLQWAGLQPQAHQDGGNILWIRAGAGSGKTFLSARVVEFFRTSSSVPFCHFFCVFDRKSKDTRAILASWIAQIAMQRKKALEIVGSFRLELGSRPASLSELWDLFDKIIVEVSNCHFLVDGFDETLRSDPSRANYEEDLRLEFLQRLTDSARLSLTSRFLIVSRDEAFVRTGLSSLENDFVELPITSADVEADMKAYAKQTVLRKLTARRLPTEETVAEVSKELVSRADGMFLWIRIQSQKLNPRSSQGQLLEAIRGPVASKDSLGRVYQRCLQSIIEAAEASGDYLPIEALRWTLSATRLLEREEFIDMLDFHQSTIYPLKQPEDRQLDILQEFTDDIIERCSPFLSFIDKTTKPQEYTPEHFRFSHYSVQEFLQGTTLFENKIKNHVHCTRRCVEYLIASISNGGGAMAVDDILGTWHCRPFLAYASEVPFTHARYGGIEAQATMETLFLSPQMSQCLDLMLAVQDSYLRECLGLSERFRLEIGPPLIPQNISPNLLNSSHDHRIWVASFLGLEHILGKLIDLGCDPNRRWDLEMYLTSQSVTLDSFSNSKPLFAAIVTGSKAAIEVLTRVTKGGLKKACCDHFLCEAAYTTEAIPGINKSFPSPLSIAIRLSDVATEQVLILEHDFDLRPDGGHGILVALLEAGANVRAHTQQTTLLTSAIYDEMIHLVKVILRHLSPLQDSDFQIICDMARLSRMAVNEPVQPKGHSLMSLLLEAFPEQTLQRFKEIAFAEAFNERFVDFVRILLDSGVLPTKTAVSDALTISRFNTQGSRLQVITLLLRHGADANNYNSEKHNEPPIFRAFDRQELELPSLLIKYGADINARDNNGNTILHKHLQGPLDVGILDFCLEFGLNINAMNSDDVTGLVAASHLFREDDFVWEPIAEEVLQNLLYLGAETNIICKGETALDVFASLFVSGFVWNKPYWRIMHLFLKRGADTSLLKNEGSKAAVAEYLEMARDRPQEIGVHWCAHLGNDADREASEDLGSRRRFPGPFPMTRLPPQRWREYAYLSVPAEITDEWPEVQTDDRASRANDQESLALLTQHCPATWWSNQSQLTVLGP